MLRLSLATALIAALVLGLSACGGDDGGEPGTNYPAAGDDNFENTTATVQIEITPEQASASSLLGAAALETIELQGPTVIRRSDPQQDGDLFAVPTEIVQLQLTGTSSLGPVIVRQSPDQPSTGEVRQQEAGQDYPAASFFDVFVEVELPEQNLVLHNEEPMRMEATLSGLPPAEGDEYRGEDDRPLYTPAGLAVGRIVDALHIPEPGGGGTPEPTATEAEATATVEPAAPTETPGGAGPATEGGCVHGTGQSVLYIAFSGLEPGQELTGTIEGPPDGLIGEGTFNVTADANGNAQVEVDIQRLGEYTWTADGISGSFTVEEECPGEPEL